MDHGTIFLIFWLVLFSLGLAMALVGLTVAF